MVPQKGQEATSKHKPITKCLDISEAGHKCV